MKKGLRRAACDQLTRYGGTDPDLMKKGLRPRLARRAVDVARTDPDLMKKGLRHFFDFDSGVGLERTQTL